MSRHSTIVCVSEAHCQLSIRWDKERRTQDVEYRLALIKAYVEIGQDGQYFTKEITSGLSGGRGRLSFQKVQSNYVMVVFRRGNPSCCAEWRERSAMIHSSRSYSDTLLLSFLSFSHCQVSGDTRNYRRGEYYPIIGT